MDAEQSSFRIARKPHPLLTVDHPGTQHTLTSGKARIGGQLVEHVMGKLRILLRIHRQPG